MQKVQDIMLAEVQGRCRGVQGGAGRCRAVQERCREVQGGLHHLHLSKHNIRCREVQALQAHLRFSFCIILSLSLPPRSKAANKNFDSFMRSFQYGQGGCFRCDNHIYILWCETLP